MTTMHVVGMLLGVLAAAGLRAEPLADHIEVEALVVTKAELRRHLAAEEGDAWQSATRKELEAAYSDLRQPFIWSCGC